MKENESKIVYAVARGIVHSHPDNYQSTDYDVVGVGKNLEEARSIAWKEIERSISSYEDAPDSDYKVTYRPDDDQINRGINNLDHTVYGHVDVFNGCKVVLFVKVYKTKMS